jgi:Lon protease-like protein
MQLPLFPLNNVLFPGCRLDLQLFEARYLDMLGRCLKQGSGFGVISILEGRETGNAPNRLADIGCEALIRDWHQQPNGLLGIRIEGGQRFRVLQASVQPDQLTCAEVQWLNELPDQPLQAEHADLAALLQALASHPMVSTLGMAQAIAGQQSLANQLACLLPISLTEKLQLLAEDHPTRRLQQVQRLLDQLQGEIQA